jgi:hypothetical protein
MIEEVEDQMISVEILRHRRTGLYHISVQHPCRIARGRAGWDLLRATRAFQEAQKKYIALCDRAVSRREFSEFIKNQSLNISIL